MSRESDIRELSNVCIGNLILEEFGTGRESDLEEFGTVCIGNLILEEYGTVCIGNNSSSVRCTTLRLYFAIFSL